MIEVVAQAVPLFVATNIDDLVVATIYLGRVRGDGAGERRVAAGQYLGFVAILGISVVAALGLRLLPSGVLPYLGLVPIALGARAGVRSWRHDLRGGGGPSERRPPSIGEVAGVTFANGGDNIGVYVPVFATAGLGATSVYVLALLTLLAVWLLFARYLAGRPHVARLLDRWGHIALPVALVAIGVVILVEGGAFR